MNEKTILYYSNGDVYIGILPLAEARRRLKSVGYKIAYSGRKFGRDGQRVLCGIDDDNQVSLNQRRINGLWNARIIHL